MKLKFFALGGATVMVVVLVVALLMVHLGFIPANADEKPGQFERHLAFTALDAWTARMATVATNPAKADEATLRAGLALYRSNCNECHGNGSGPSMFGAAFYPPAPQFTSGGPHDDDYLLFYTVKHGIRLTGMPAFQSMLKDDEIWQLITFIKHIKDLPPDILQDYNTHHSHAAAPPPSASPSP